LTAPKTDPFGRDPFVQDDALATYARLLTSSHHTTMNLAREVFDDATRLGATRGPGSAAARIFAKLGPHIQTRNTTERAIVSSLLAAPLPLGLGPAPLFLSEVLRSAPPKVRQGVYRLYRGGALDVAGVFRGRTRVETFLVVARPRKLAYRLTWGAGPFGRID
jgi:hypothetical protein